MSGGYNPNPEVSGTGTISALNGTVVLVIPAFATVSVNISGTWSATLTFEGSVDGAAFFPIRAIDTVTGTTSTTATANGSYTIPVGGYQSFRVRASAYSSGTATIAYNADSTPTVQSSRQITGGTDSATIGNVGDRLKVDSLGSVSPVPSSNTIAVCQKLTNGGSVNMGVNGSVTPVNFDWAPPSGETWYISSISMLLWDNGTTTPTSFGSIGGGLANGVQVNIRTNGTEYTYANLQDNMEIAQCFRDNYFVPGTSGLFETSDLVVCQIKFPVPIRLTQATSDYIRFRIRDNLTGVDAFRASTIAWKAI